MAQEVGAAYVTIMPSARGFGKSVEGEMGGAFDASEQKASGGFKSMFGKVAKWGAVAIGAIGTAVGGLAIKGGISRQLNIEDAQAKLLGLGHTTEGVTSIMQSALAAVKGTAFGLDAAATTAAGAVAAGIKPGQELERYLKLTADAATIAGISMGEMGSIMNKVQANGRAMTENLNQLSDRGIPILGWLADEYGVTSEAMSKMVSEGKVDAETFNRVLEENIGGAALKSGDTTRGAFANMGAALSRVGVTLTAGFFPLFKDVFNQITEILDGLNTRMGPWSEKFSGWFQGAAGPAIDGLADKVLGFVDSISSGEGPFAGFLAILTPLGTILKGLAPIFPELGDALLKVGQEIGAALLPVLPVLGDALVAVAGAIAPLLPIIGGALVEVIQAVSPLIAQLVPIVMSLLDAFLPILPVLASLVSALLPVLASVVLAVLGAITPLLPVVSNLAQTLFPVLANIVLTLLGAILPLVPVILGLVNALSPILAIVGELIAALLPPLLEAFVTLLNPILALIGPLAASLAPILQIIGELIGQVLVPWLGFLSGALGALVGALAPVIVAIAGGLVSAITTAIKWVGGIVGAVAELVSKAIPKIAEFAREVAAKIGDAIQWFRDLPGMIGDVVSGAGNWLKDTGKKVIDGFIEGIKGAFQGVRNTLGDLTSKLTEWKGPPARDATLLRGAGRLIIGGLVDGFRDGEGEVKGFLASLTDDIARTDFPALSGGVNGDLSKWGGANAAVGSGNSGPQVALNVYPQPGQSEEAIGAAAARTLQFQMAGVTMP